MMATSKQQLLQSYREHLIICCLAKSTNELYYETAQRFFEFIPGLQIDRETVYDFIKQFEHMAPGSQNQRRSAMRKLLKFLGENLDKSLANIKIHSMKIGRKLPKMLSETDMFAILAKMKRQAKEWMGMRDYAMVYLLYATGARVSEALALEWENIRDGWLRINDGKGGKDRFVPIPQKVVDVLEAYRKACPYDLKQTMFVNYKGQTIDRVSAYKIVKNATGGGPHTLRHTFATHLIQNGCDISVVADFLGHSSLHTTQIYTHIQKPHLRETVNQCHPMSEGAAHAL